MVLKDSIRYGQKSLWELAQTISEKRVIPATDPQTPETWIGGKAIGIYNPQMKISLWGPPKQLTWSINKTDVWDRRYFQKREMTLAEIKKDAFSKHPHLDPWYPNSLDRYYYGMAAYDFPCAKPVGQVILLGEDPADQNSLEARIEYGKRNVLVPLNKKGSIKTFLMMTRNILVMEGEFQGLKNPVSLRLYRHKDTGEYGKSYNTIGTYYDRPFYLEKKVRSRQEKPLPCPVPYDYSRDKGNGPLERPEAGSDGRFFWIYQKLPPERTFPKGFEYVMMGTVLGSFGEVQVVNGEKGLGTPPHLTPEQQARIDKRDLWAWTYLPMYKNIREADGSAVTVSLTKKDALKFTLLVTVVTTNEAKDIFKKAKTNLLQAEWTGLEKLKEENSQWWQKYWQKREAGRIFYRDREKTEIVVKDLSLAWTWHHSGSTCSDPTKYECDAAYLHFEQDFTLWHGMTTFDEPEYHCAFLRNQIDRLERWFKIVRMLLPGARKAAKRIYGCRGAVFPISYGPFKTETIPHSDLIWEQIMELYAAVAKLFWQHYLYTADKTFLEKEGYPVLKAGAQFYSDYVTRGKDGFYHIVPTVSPEHWGLWKKFERNQDSASALTLVKYNLKSAVQAAEILGKDQNERKRWLEIAKNLAPYPTYQTKEGPIFVDVKGAPPIQYNIPVPLAPVFWGDDITMDSSREELEIARRTFRNMAQNLNWIGSFRRCRMLLGEELEPCDQQILEPENLLNCRSGRMRFFPTVPKDVEVAFQRFLAVGAFEVSAEKQKDASKYIEVRSLAGNDCVFINPWPGKKVRIIDKKTGKEIACIYGKVPSGDQSVTFFTIRLHTYLIVKR